MNIPAVIFEAEIADVDVIHAGHGGRAENADLAGVCRSGQSEVLGPSPETHAMVGRKAQHGRGND